MWCSHSRLVWYRWIKAYPCSACGAGTFQMYLCNLWRWKLLNDDGRWETLMCMYFHYANWLTKLVALFITDCGQLVWLYMSSTIKLLYLYSYCMVYGWLLVCWAVTYVHAVLAMIIVLFTLLIVVIMYWWGANCCKQYWLHCHCAWINNLSWLRIGCSF